MQHFHRCVDLRTHTEKWQKVCHDIGRFSLWFHTRLINVNFSHALSRNSLGWHTLELISKTSLQSFFKWPKSDFFELRRTFWNVSHVEPKSMFPMLFGLITQNQWKFSDTGHTQTFATQANLEKVSSLEKSRQT